MLLLLLLLLAVDASAVIATGTGGTVVATVASVGAAASSKTPNMHTTAILGPSDVSLQATVWGKGGGVYNFPPRGTPSSPPDPAAETINACSGGGRRATGACIYRF
jgi:hypothetical protein